jgi:catechol-2,3-dioxygenase
MTVRPRRIAHVGLTTANLERFVAFYEEALGFQVSDRMPFADESPYYEGVWMRCNADHHVVSVFGLRDATQTSDDRQAPRPGLHHVAYEMSSFEDLKRAARYVREHDVPLQGMRTGGPGCQLRLYLFDPDGNIIELYWGLDQIGWDGKARPFPEVSEVDLETLDLDAWLEAKGAEFTPAAAATTREVT